MCVWEEEVVILMPNFATQEVEHAMAMVFMASGVTNEKSEIKAQSGEGPMKSITQCDSKKEEEDFKAKEEEYLQVKHEVGSEDDMYLDNQNDSCDIDDERSDNVKKVRRSLLSDSTNHHQKASAGANGCVIEKASRLLAHTSAVGGRTIAL